MTRLRRIGRRLAAGASAAAVCGALAYAGWTSISAAPTRPATAASGDAAAGYQLFDDDESPRVPDSGPDSPVEVGMKWISSEPGVVTALRFYKAPANTGRHVGHLWSSGGRLLASAVFTDETPSGWQTARLATPLAIRHGQTYIASYHTTTGHYAFDPDYFVSPRARGPLQAPQNTTVANGVFAYGPEGTFPSGSFNASNYWVDVVVSPAGDEAAAAPAAPAGAERAAADKAACPCTLFGETAPSAVDGADLPVEVGLQWRPDVNGVVTAIRFFKAPGAAPSHEVHLWTGAGRLLASARAADETLSGWQEARLATPVAVKAGSAYVASYFSESGRYAYDRGFFSTPRKSGPLGAAGSPVANGVFSYGSESTFPSRSFNATNYWVDVVFERR